MSDFDVRDSVTSESRPEGGETDEVEADASGQSDGVTRVCLECGTDYQGETEHEETEYIPFYCHCEECDEMQRFGTPEKYEQQ